jgi:1-deoxy-D-xylulose-5-phosphate synthase
VVAVYSTFLTRAIDQVTYDVGLHGLPVVFCLDRAGITGDDGPSHHGVLDMALLTKVPGMTLFAPSSYQELGVMLHDALDLCDGPAAIRWSKTAAPQAGADQVGEGLRARRVRSGRDLCLLAVGKMLAAAEAAASELAEEGLDVTVWDVRVVPPDPEMLADAAEHPLVLTLEDGVRDGGVGSLLADRISQLTEGRTPPRVKVLGIPVAYLDHGKADDILAGLGLDGVGVAAEARRLVAALRT